MTKENGCKLTKFELQVMNGISTKRIEEWARKEEYWKIYHVVIQKTKKELSKVI
jgi:hypothetical protein